MRRIAIKCNLIDRDQGSFVAEAQQKVAAQVDLPPGYRIVWSGQFENQQRAMKRLSIIVPISLGLIFVLLFWAFMSIKNALLILMNVPFAMIGGILILLATGINLSVSAAVGFIALFGIAVQNGVILVSQLNKLRREGQSLARCHCQWIRQPSQAGRDDCADGDAGSVSCRTLNQCRFGNGKTFRRGDYRRINDRNPFDLDTVTGAVSLFCRT